MGKKNKQRRKAGHPASGTGRPASPGAAFGAPQGWGSAGEPSPPPRERSPQEVVAGFVSTAIHAFAAGDHPGVQTAIEALVERPNLDGWRATTEGALTTYLSNVIRAAWQRGWQPADVARIVGRQFGSRHVRLVADVIAADLQRYAMVTLDPRWPAQLAELEAQVWWAPEQTYLRAWCELPNNDWVAVIPMAVELVALLNGLPTLEQLGPKPGTARPPTGASASRSAGRDSTSAAAEGSESPVDERMLSRIRNLLAKAEATGFPAEAEALTAAAQERMARYSIDAAMLAATAVDNKDKPAGRRIGIDNPYEPAKAVLLNAVATANRCRSVWSKSLGFCTVIGFEPDLDAVEALFTSLLVQATTAVTKAGSGAGAGARSRTKSFRQSFLAAYAHRIGERLAEITEAQTVAATAEPGGGNLLPVLASRDRAVESTLAEMFPSLTQKSTGTITDAEGWHSGRGAADLAALHRGEALPDAAR
jgi:hypothetical protein